MTDFKAEVARQFDRGAVTYDRYARVQAEMAVRLMSRLAARPEQFVSILELGCGTGSLTAALAAAYPEAAITAIELSEEMVDAAWARTGDRIQYLLADAETVDLPEGAFDLIVSNATVQWFEAPGPTIAALARALTPGGVMLHATFGPATFRELGAVLDDIEGPRRRGLPLPKPGEWVAMLEAAGLSEVACERLIEKLCYQGLGELLRSIKGVGAGFVPDRDEPPWKRYVTLKEAIRRYDERFAAPGGVSVTYELLEVIGIATTRTL